jgi:phosphohistidine swiveling domain-containing protein
VTEISDHAVLRFLERVKGVDIAQVRAEMNSPALRMADEFGCPVLIGRNGERLVIREGVVVTVVAKRQWHLGRTAR